MKENLNVKILVNNNTFLSNPVTIKFLKNKNIKNENSINNNNNNPQKIIFIQNKINKKIYS